MARLGGVFEHSPWVAQAAWRKRPFGSLDELHAAMVRAVEEADEGKKLALVRAHPELAARTTLTIDSKSEQGRLGFDRVTPREREELDDVNRRYREKFGFPCIVALRLHDDRSSVIAEMKRRLESDARTELARALEQIAHITRGRLEKLVG